MEKISKPSKCKHPPTRQFSWFAFNYKTGKNDILCVGCCACGKVLTGGVDGDTQGEKSSKPLPRSTRGRLF